MKSDCYEHGYADGYVMRAYAPSGGTYQAIGAYQRGYYNAGVEAKQLQARFSSRPMSWDGASARRRVGGTIGT